MDSRLDQAQRIQRILQEVIAAQRDVAGREEVVLMDLHAAMGGAGSAERWATVQPPLARPDMTHFTNEGYNLLGCYIVGGIMKLYGSGVDALDSIPPRSPEGKENLGEVIPPLYPGMTRGAILSAGSRGGSYPEPSSSPTQIYYFLMPDGQVVVTNDLSMIDSRQGRVIGPEEAGCLLRGKASPCDNATRWKS